MNTVDTQGRLVISTSGDLTFTLDADNRYIRREADTSCAAGIIITFQDADSDIRIKNGKLQANAGGLWYYFQFQVINGRPVMGLSDAGEA